MLIAKNKNHISDGTIKNIMRGANYEKVFIPDIGASVCAGQPAGSMKCGTHLIEDGQITGQSRSEVEEKCGTPESSSGNNLYYKIGNGTYRLHFNDGNELESITEEVE